MCSKFASSKFASSKIKNKKALIKLNVRLTFSSFLFCRSSQIKCSCQSASLCFLTKGQVVSVQSWEPTGFPGVAAQSTNTSEGCFNKSNYLERSLTELLTVWNKYLLSQPAFYTAQGDFICQDYRCIFIFILISFF